MGEESRIPVNTDTDIVIARQKGRQMAAQLGFSSIDLTLVATAISELARNIVRYAKKGEITLKVVEEGNRRGLSVIAQDEGPGIANIEVAIQTGFSTSGSLGMGLPGVKLLMDEFEIVSKMGEGTTVAVTKWKR